MKWFIIYIISCAIALNVLIGDVSSYKVTVHDRIFLAVIGSVAIPALIMLGLTRGFRRG